MSALAIRPAERAEFRHIWPTLEPALRRGDVFAWPRDWSEAEAQAAWHGPGARVFMAWDGALALASSYLKPNALGGGDHVANAGFVTHPAQRGRGAARALGLHALETARSLGFSAMQFNFVVSSNADAVHLWTRLGFSVIGRIPEGFRHPERGLVDVLIMHQRL